MAVFLFACSAKDDIVPVGAPEDGVVRLPVVIHIIHDGEPIGQGYNLSEERIETQIKLLNDDFRRRKGTRGYNTHPAGADAKIEFVLASIAPDGTETNGIVRIDRSAVDNPVPPNSRFNYYAHYSYWDSEAYINIWVEPLAPSTIDLVLGEATGPETDLPGAELLLEGEPFQVEGILINSFHFGETAIDSDYNLGRTLTHEMGHYLGLLHTWGSGDCETNDYCSDTPPVSKHTSGCPTIKPLACDGSTAMTENYMDYTADACMNIFTSDQVYRMWHVLKHSPRRKNLVRSRGLGGCHS